MTGLPQGMAVGEDVGGFQQLVMAEAAEGEALLVGAEHALADHCGHTVPPRGRRRRLKHLPALGP